MSGSKVSRRVSEFVGVALFAAALIWIVSLASYDPSDAAWFFSTGSHAAPANFAGRVGAFLAELSFQLFGYAAFMIPAVFVIIGWTYFWCRSFDAPGTKATGAALLVAAISTFLSLVFGTVVVSGKPFRAGGYTGEFLALEMSEYLARAGSLIVILTLIFLAVIMTTQFSFGRFFAAVMKSLKASGAHTFERFRAWREEKRREKQRREVFAKHTKKGTPMPDLKAPPPAPVIADPMADRSAKASRSTAGDAPRPAEAARVAAGARNADSERGDGARAADGAPAP